jgi:hypothetical protein
VVGEDTCEEDASKVLVLSLGLHLSYNFARLALLALGLLLDVLALLSKKVLMTNL